MLKVHRASGHGERLGSTGARDFVANVAHGSVEKLGELKKLKLFD